MRTHTRGDKRKCALEMMAEKEVEKKEEGVHVQGGQYFGIGSYVSTSRTPACFDPDIIYSMLRCSLLSFNIAASSVCTASSPGLGHSTPAT